MIKEKLIRQSLKLDSGRVKQFILSSGLKVTQITTFCPDIIGPGPCHSYVIEDDCLILVDTGLPTHIAKKMFYYWRQQKIPPEIEDLPDNFSETELNDGLKAAGYSMNDIDLMIISHGHLDHYLMGETIVKNSGANVAAHILDTDIICNPWVFSKKSCENRPRYMAMGMNPPKSSISDYHDLLAGEAIDFSLKVDYPILAEGPLSINGFASDCITIKHTPGHSPGAICMIIGSDKDNEKLLLCGDVILYPITPQPDDLLKYLRTLNDLEQLQNITAALPGHGKNIRTFNKRVSILKQHHRHRLYLTYTACSIPKSPWDIASMPQYFDTYVDPEKFNPMAGNETFVHMQLLEMVNGLKRTNIKKDVIYFQNSGEKFDQVYGRVLELIDDRIFTML